MLNYELAKIELARAVEYLQRARDALTDDQALGEPMNSCMEGISVVIEEIECKTRATQRQTALYPKQHPSIHRGEE